MTQTPPVCCVCTLCTGVVCLQSLQKAPLMSSSYTNQLNSISQFFEFFHLCYRRLYQLSTSLLGGRLNNIRIGIRTVGSFFRMVLELATEEDVLAPKKERISMSSCRYLIDPSNLATYKKKTPPSVQQTELTELYARELLREKC